MRFSMVALEVLSADVRFSPRLRVAVAAFPQGAGTAVAVIAVAYVASTQGFHHVRHLAAGGGRHQEMHVMGHEDARVDVAALAQGDLAQVLQVAHTVYVSEEARLTTIAALDDVLRNVGWFESGMAGHGGVRAGRAAVSVRQGTPSVGISREPKSTSVL